MAKDWGCSVKELLERVDSPEMTEWIAFYALEAEDEKAATDAAK